MLFVCYFSYYSDFYVFVVFQYLLGENRLLSKYLEIYAYQLSKHLVPSLLSLVPTT